MLTKGIGADFYWLGRVPCRTVCLIGLVVGVQVFESRVLYSSECFFSFFFFCEGLALGLRPRRVVDDGTAVIDCAHRVQRAPKTPGNKTHSVVNKPAARIGLSIKVIGKVHRAYGTRQVQVDELGELDCWLG